MFADVLENLGLGTTKAVWICFGWLLTPDSNTNKNSILSDIDYISQLNFIRRGIRCYTILIILLLAIYQQPSLLVVFQNFVSQAITNAISALIIDISLPEYFNLFFFSSKQGLSDINVKHFDEILLFIVMF